MLSCLIETTKMMFSQNQRKPKFLISEWIIGKKNERVLQLKCILVVQIEISFLRKITVDFDQLKIIEDEMRTSKKTEKRTYLAFK